MNSLHLSMLSSVTSCRVLDRQPNKLKAVNASWVQTSKCPLQFSSLYHWITRLCHNLKRHAQTTTLSPIITKYSCNSMSCIILEVLAMTKLTGFHITLAVAMHGKYQQICVSGMDDDLQDIFVVRVQLECPVPQHFGVCLQLSCQQCRGLTTSRWRPNVVWYGIKPLHNPWMSLQQWLHPLAAVCEQELLHVRFLRQLQAMPVDMVPKVLKISASLPCFCGALSCSQPEKMTKHDVHSQKIHPSHLFSPDMNLFMMAALWFWRMLHTDLTCNPSHF